MYSSGLLEKLADDGRGGMVFMKVLDVVILGGGCRMFGFDVVCTESLFGIYSTFFFLFFSSFLESVAHRTNFKIVDMFFF